MTTYNNDYNRNLASRQRALDYANIANDKYEAHEDDALHGGKRKGKKSRTDLLKDMDFNVYGKGVATMEGEGLKEDFDDALKWIGDKAEKIGKIVETGSKIHGLITGKKKDDTPQGMPYMPYRPYGYGLSGGAMHGGSERGAELADILNPAGSPYVPAIKMAKTVVPNAPRVLAGTGKKKGRIGLAYPSPPGLNVVGSDLRMKGSNYSPSWHQIQAEQARDGFIGNGMSGGDFFGDIGNALQTVAPFLPLLGLGMSGGDFFGDLGNIAQSVAPFLPLLGLGRNGDPDDVSFKGGDFFSDLGNIAQQVAPFLPLLGLGKNVRKGSKEARRFIALVRALKKNKGLVGKGFFDDFLSGLKQVGDVIGAVAPHVETGMKIYDKFGKKGSGLSGGMTHEQDMNMADAMGDIFSGEGKLQIIHGGGAGQYDMPELLGMEGKGYSGGDLGQIASAMGLGMSGGADYSAQEEGISEPLATMFLGGRHPSTVPKAEKKMLFLKALADAKLHQELGRQLRGKGMSGGALLKGLGLSGGDFWSDFADGFKQGFTGTLNVAKQALPFLPLLGLGESGGAMSGCGRTDYDNSSTAGQFSYGQMGDTAGKANGGVGGQRPMQGFGEHNLKLKPQMKGCSLSGFGDLNREVGGKRPRSAPAGGWIAHVKAYAKQHGCSYKDALKRAGATYKK